MRSKAQSGLAKLARAQHYLREVARKASGYYSSYQPDPESEKWAMDGAIFMGMFAKAMWPDESRLPTFINIRRNVPIPNQEDEHALAV